MENTQEVIDWFKGIDNKQNKFITFDIKDLCTFFTSKIFNS